MLKSIKRDLDAKLSEGPCRSREKVVKRQDTYLNYYTLQNDWGFSGMIFL